LGVLGLVAAAGMLTVLGGLLSLFSVLVSPVALLVLAFIALAAAVVGAIVYWDELRAAFGDTSWFQAIVIMVTPVVLLFRILGALLGL
ncbi:phage tail tape measure protein, partial [Pseudomonas aeruginosa]